MPARRAPRLRLKAAGVKHIVVLTRLKGISVERTLAAQLRDVNGLEGANGTVDSDDLDILPGGWTS